MKRFSIKSKQFGVVIVTVDDEDAYLLRSNIWTCSGKQTPIIKRTILGTSKCLSHVIMEPNTIEYVSHINGCQLDFRKTNLLLKTRKNYPKPIAALK